MPNILGNSGYLSFSRACFFFDEELQDKEIPQIREYILCPHLFIKLTHFSIYYSAALDPAF